MAVNITYFVHGTTTDNENGISTGCNQGELSALGKKQSVELIERVKNKMFDVVFCSDLKRAVDSAHITFGMRKIPIIQDKRLRECDYGRLNGASSEIVEPMALKCIDKPFPDGESYKDVEMRIRSFLKDLLKKYDGKRVAIVCHKAPQLAIEVVINKRTWAQAFEEDWREKKPKAWKPGWDYELTSHQLS